jgi:thymidylate synthase
MQKYFDIINTIRKENAGLRTNRTKVQTIKTTGTMFKHDMGDGFPIMTTKKINPQTSFTETEFFIQGIHDKQWLKDHNCNIWNGWCDPRLVPYGHDEETQKRMAETNELGRIYGVQWRDWGGKKDVTDKNLSIKIDWSQGIDQLKNAHDKLLSDPNDRRMIVMAWNPSELDQMALPPCHIGFMFTSDGEYLDLTFWMRSVDTFLGMPFNITSYGMILELMAKTVGMRPRYLVGQFADTHIYSNHLEQIELQLTREPYPLPKLILPDDVNIFTWTADQWELEGYKHHPFIKGNVAI